MTRVSYSCLGGQPPLLNRATSCNPRASHAPSTQLQAPHTTAGLGQSQAGVKATVRRRGVHHSVVHGAWVRPHVKKEVHHLQPPATTHAVGCRYQWRFGPVAFQLRTVRYEFLGYLQVGTLRSHAQGPQPVFTWVLDVGAS